VPVRLLDRRNILALLAVGAQRRAGLLDHHAIAFVVDGSATGRRVLGAPHGEEKRDPRL